MLSPAKPAFEEVDEELGAPKLGRTDAPVEFLHRYRLVYFDCLAACLAPDDDGQGSSQTTRLKRLAAEKIGLRLND